MRAILLLWIFLLSLAALPALAQAPVRLDFETYPGPDGRLGTADDVATPACGGGPIGICPPIGGSYAAAGIVFASGTLAQGGLFPGSPATNHFVTSSPPDVLLSFPVYGVTLTSHSQWSAVLYAFDSAGALVAASTLTHPAPGTGFFLGTLSVTASTPIARFVVLEASCTVGGPCSQILNLDDFVLATALPPPTPVGSPAPVAVPTASTWSLLLMSLLIATFAARRLRGRSPSARA